MPTRGGKWFPGHEPVRPSVSPISQISRFQFQREGGGPREDVLRQNYADIYLSRNMIGSVVSVGTSPTLLLKTPITWPHIILNPARLQGITKIETGYSGTITATTNTQADYIEVSGYESAHLSLVVTACTGEWAIHQQSYDSISATWLTIQTVFTVTSTGSEYALLGQMGIAERLAFNIEETSAGSLTFTLGIALKGGSGTGSISFSNVIYLGGPNVTTVAGLPLLPGERQSFIVGAGVEVYGVATATTEARVFSL